MPVYEDWDKYNINVHVATGDMLVAKRNLYFFDMQARGTMVKERSISIFLGRIDEQFVFLSLTQNLIYKTVYVISGHYEHVTDAIR
jgi:hypothetical protein